MSKKEISEDLQGTPEDVEKQETEEETREPQEKTLQEKINEDLARGNISGARVVSKTDAPPLNADWLAHAAEDGNRETAYSLVEVILQNPKLQYEKFSILVRRGEQVSDNLVIQQIVSATIPDDEQIAKKLENAENLITKKEQQYLDERSAIRKRVTLTRFIYNPLPEGAAEGTAPTAMFFWDDPSSGGYDVRKVALATVNTLYAAYLAVNPQQIPQEVRERFQSVQ